MKQGAQLAAEMADCGEDGEKGACREGLRRGRQRSTTALWAMWSPWPQYAHVPGELRGLKDSGTVVTVIVALELVERGGLTLAGFGGVSRWGVVSRY